ARIQPYLDPRVDFVEGGGSQLAVPFVRVEPLAVGQIPKQTEAVPAAAGGEQHFHLTFGPTQSNVSLVDGRTDVDTVMLLAQNADAHAHERAGLAAGIERVDPGAHGDALAPDDRFGGGREHRALARCAVVAAQEQAAGSLITNARRQRR